MTKFQLMELMFTRNTGSRDFKDSSGRPHHGVLVSVSREDGGGSSFILTVCKDLGARETFHMRTID